MYAHMYASEQQFNKLLKPATCLVTQIHSNTHAEKMIFPIGYANTHTVHQHLLNINRLIHMRYVDGCFI